MIFLLLNDKAIPQYIYSLRAIKNECINGIFSVFEVLLLNERLELEKVFQIPRWAYYTDQHGYGAFSEKFDTL